MTEMTEWLAYLSTGIVSSFLSGLLGIGGGLIVIPSLLFIFSYFHVGSTDILMHLVIGTSLASAIVNLFVSLRAHSRQGNVQWSTFRAMYPGVLAGALIIAPAIMSVISGNILQMIFGIFCFISSTLMFFPPKQSEQQEENLPNKKILALLGLFTGTLSVLLGLAGGVITSTILNHYHMNMRKIIGTTASIAFVLAISGTVSMMFLGYHETDILPKWSTGFIYWPALLCLALPSLFFTPLGARMAQTIPIHLLKKSFAVLIFVVGFKMLA